MARGSLRLRFVIFALACLLPLLGVVLFVLDQSLVNSRAQLLDTQIAARDVVAQGLAATLDENQRVLAVLAADSEVEQMSPASGALLGSFWRARPNLRGLFLVNAAGQAVAMAGLDPSPFRAAYEPALEHALSVGETGVSNRIAAPDGAVIAIVSPVLAQDNAKGQPVGAVGALLSVERLEKTFLPFLRGDTTIAVVAQGEIIAAPPAGGLEAADLTTRLAKPIAAAVAGASGTLSYEDNTGSERLAVYAPVPFPATNWAVVVTNPSPRTYGPNHVLLKRGLGALAVAAAVALVLAIALGEVTARPLRLLTAEAAALAGGDFSQRFQRVGGGEVGVLSAALGEMADRLAEQVRDLETARTERELQAEQLRDLNRRTVRLQESERRRIAAEIHDAVSPLITGALYQTRAVRLSDGNGGQDEALAAAGDLLERATVELHRVIFDLRPPDLDDIGVVAAIERYVAQVQRTGLSSRLEVVGEPPSLTPEVRLGIYRIVQEALHNALRHSGADEVVVRLEATDEALRVTVRDNGAGFDPERAIGPWSLGLLSMRERAAAIGATLEISSRPGGGTAITIERAVGDDVAELTPLVTTTADGHEEATG